MFFIRVVVFTHGLLPSVIFGEEGVGTLRNVGYLCQTQTVGKRKGLPIDAFSTYYIYVFFGGTALQCCLY